METVITYGIVYLLVFRLAVLLLGGLCIFYGYRLFLVRGRESGSGPEQGSEMHGKIGTSELTIKSTAPGIFFSAFGAAIVIAVLAGSQPDVKYDEKQSSTQTGETVQQRSTALRSLPPADATQPDAGTADYNSVVRDIPEAIDRLRTAVSMAPDNPDYRDLLARLLFAWGKVKEAVAEQQRAVELVDTARREEFQARLNLYQQGGM
ncbi:MAG: tetratricopeptide repeat protein [Candidatus Electrothrix sp. YB6]